LPEENFSWRSDLNHAPGLLQGLKTLRQAAALFTEEYLQN
jgi:hypothetical protein